MARREITAGVPSVYVHLLFEYLASVGIDGTALLGEKAPEAGALALGRYPLISWRRLLEKASAHLDDPLLGLHVGRRVTPAHAGVLGYLMLPCPSLGAMFERYVQFERLFYDVGAARLLVNGEFVRLEWNTGAGVTGPLVDECALAALTQFVRNVALETVPVESVGFMNPKPRRVGPYREFFGGLVHFEARSTWLNFPASVLGVPLRSPDPLLLEVLDRQASAVLADRVASDDFCRKAGRTIARALREGDPSDERVAALLHLSTRTLHRRLEQYDTTFRALLDARRQDLSVRRLRDGRTTMGELASQLGYTDQSTFTRAFKRWMGVSPTEWRKARVG